MPSYQLDPGRDAPARLGRYELLGHLATGGMAEIHLARLAGEAGFEKIVVVKRLLPELVASPAYVAMFLDEGKLVARLDHPNVCEVHELGRDGSEYYLAMPYLDGISVHELIARPRDPDRIPELRVAASVIVQACAGLHHAHELRDADGAPAGLVHRDVSPSNLFVTSSGTVKVLDFGIAKVRGAAETEVGTIKGKQQYMAPEQLLGEALDRRCDVFAIGIVLYELATHQRLFKRTSDYLAARAILEEPIPRADTIDPAIPRSLADVIAKALSRDAGGRFADVREVARAIETAMAPHGGLVGPAVIAAAVTSTDELTAQRTRQARVLGDARSRASSESPTSPREPQQARTRPMRNTAPRPIDDQATEMMSSPEFTKNLADGRVRARRNAVIALATILLAVAAFGLVLYLSRDLPDVRRASPVALAGDAGSSDALPIEQAPPADAASIEASRPDAEVADADVILDESGRGSGKIRVPGDAARPRKKHGQLSIDSTPYATIYLDGVSLGVTPIVKRSLPAGRHKLRAILEDGRTRDLTIEVPAGKLATPINLTGW